MLFDRSVGRADHSAARNGVVQVAVVLLAASLTGRAVAAPRGKRQPYAIAPPATAVQPGPACHPGRHVLTYHGGDLVTHVAVFVLFWGPQWQTDAEHQAAAGALRTMLHQLTGSPYGCSWQEWELPGNAIGAGSYLGDEIIPTDPILSGGQLDDASIQARIVAEVDAKRAPVATDDTFYVVVPPKGVPVVSGGDTGCGGSRFTFCGYHDSFAHAGQRFRYTVLPYPCSQGGGTCFVDPQNDPGRALQAVGSHELAETVTDPDSPPVGNGAWFDDRNGLENADICESVACLVDLPVGAEMFTVNSLWSNLAGACVASAPCIPPPIECTDPAPGACVANTKATQGCALELLVDPNLTSDRHSGLPGSKITCADGQTFCDSDATHNGACTFRVAICLNNVDGRLQCTPSSVSAVQLSAKLSRSSDPADQANVRALLAALAAVDTGSVGTVSGGTVSFTPAASTPNACSGFIDLVVPVRPGGTGTLSGTRSVDLRAQTPAGLVKEKLRLICKATFP
jgi:hypothetical protein